MFKTIRNQALEGSQYGDVRPLSSVCTSLVSFGCDDVVGKMPKIIATGGWSGGIKIWNGGCDYLSTTQNATNANTEAAPLDLLGSKSSIHEDRIMNIAMRPYITSITATNSLTIVASASIDLSAKLCAVKLNDEAIIGDSMGIENLTEKDNKLRYNIEECAHLKGHAARLCSVAFHPTEWRIPGIKLF